MPVSVPTRTLPFLGDALRLRRDGEWKQTDARDDAQFAAMVERNAGFLYRMAYSLLRHRQDAEDAVQDCLLKLHRSGAWRNMREERAFLARSCWRAALDLLSRRGTVHVEADDSTVPGYENTPERDALRNADGERLHALIDALPLKLREALLLSGFEELNSREIAMVLGIPEGTVRTRLKRAREQIRQQWFAHESGSGSRLRRSSKGGQG